MSAKTNNVLSGPPEDSECPPPGEQPVMGHVLMSNVPPTPQPSGYPPAAGNPSKADFNPSGPPGAGSGVPPYNQAPAYGYGNNSSPQQFEMASCGVDGNAQYDNSIQPSLRDWNNGLFVCCSDCDSCLEACCCYYPQLSRQYNVIMGERTPTINWFVCLGAWCGDACYGHFASAVLQFIVRSRLRRHYNIAGSDCGDGVLVCCCANCALQQTLLEMTHCGSFPGACCYEAPTQRTMT